MLRGSGEGGREFVCRMPSHSGPPGKEKERVVIATDASKRYGGWLVWKKGRVIKMRCHRLDPKEHIFYKELRMACTGIEEGVQLLPRGGHLTLLVDALAVVYCLRNGISGTSLGNSIMAKALSLVREKQIHLSVHHISGPLNPADEISRRKPIRESKLKNFDLWHSMPLKCEAAGWISIEQWERDRKQSRSTRKSNWAIEFPPV